MKWSIFLDLGIMLYRSKLLTKPLNILFKKPKNWLNLNELKADLTDRLNVSSFVR